MKKLRVHKELMKYFAERSKQILNFIDNSKKRITETLLHELRIEIKKLKALILFIDHSVKDYDMKENFKPFREIFKQAGKIREIGLKKESLKKLGLSDSLKNYAKIQRKEEKERKANFRELIASGIAKDIKVSINNTRKKLKELGRKELESFLSDKRKKILVYLKSQVLEKKKVHELRILLKQYNYLLKIINGDEKTHGRIDDLLEMIGNWHDQELMAIELDKRIQEEQLPVSTLTKVQKVRTKLVTMNADLFRKIDKKRKTGIVS